MDTQHYKELLEKELAVVESELGTVGRKNPSRKEDWEPEEKDTDVDRADETEVADSITEFEDNAAILAQLESRLNEIKVALQRIEEGTYGICIVGGEKIEEDRLEANPAATTCKAHMN